MYDGYSKYGEREAEEYDGTREKEPLWNAENRFVERFFAERAVARLLDAPVGTGRFLPYYRRAAQVIGIDVSDDMLSQARQRVAASRLSGVELLKGDILRLPYPDRHFEVAVSWRFLHLLPGELLVPALSELRRVTSGEVLVQVYEAAPVPLQLLARLKRLVGRLARIGSRPAKQPWSHIRAYYHSRHAVEHAARQAGLRLVAREPIGETRERVVALVLRPA